MSEEPHHWLFDHWGKVTTALGVALGAAMTWTAHSLKVETLRMRLERFAIEDKEIHSKLEKRLDKHYTMLVEQRQDLHLLMQKVDLHMSDERRQEEIERLAEVQIKMLKKMGVLGENKGQHS